MSTISVVDSKESNSIEFLNIPEVPEIIDVNNFREVQRSRTNDQDNGVVEYIKLDKTNIDTYMNDLNKNFYNIKSSNVILDDIYELHTHTKDTSNAKDFRNKSYEEYKLKNKAVDVKHIQPVPIGRRGLSSSLNGINTSISLVKSTINAREKTTPLEADEFLEEGIPCTGFSYGTNFEYTFPEFSTSWSTRLFYKTVPMNVNLSIPGFIITSGDVTNLPGLAPILQKGLVVTDKCEGKYGSKDLFFNGIPCGAYKDRCHNFALGWHDCTKYNGLIYQIVYKKVNYTNKTLIDFNKLGVNFQGSISSAMSLRFELYTNISVQVILDIVKKYDKVKYESIRRETNKKVLIGKLKDIFTLENILQIMISAYSFCVDNDVVSPYVDFIITSIKVDLNFIVSTFNVNYGSNKYEIGGFNYNKMFEGLTDGKYITFSINPKSLEIEAFFTFFEGTYLELLNKQASTIVLSYVQALLSKVPIKSGIFVVLLIIICEQFFGIQAELDSYKQFMSNPSPQLQNKVSSLIKKKSELEKHMNDIVDFINKLSKINVGGSLSFISGIIEAIQPTISLSIGICASIGTPAVLVGCASIALPELDIKNYVKNALTEIGKNIPKIEIGKKISEKLVDLAPANIKNAVKDYNRALESSENVLKIAFNESIKKTFDLFDTAGIGLIASPSVDLCVAL